MAILRLSGKFPFHVTILYLITASFSSEPGAKVRTFAPACLSAAQAAYVAAVNRPLI